MTGGEPLQRVVHTGERGRIVAVGSAYDTRPENRGRDVVVNASYCGVLPARFVGAHLPRGAIGVDCGIGPEGAGINGLWFLEALGVPAATADVMTVRLGDGPDLYEHGVISRFNQPAGACGVTAGQPVGEAARFLLENDPAGSRPEEVTNREVMATGPGGRRIVCTDSIAFGLPEDRDSSVLVTAGHTGRSALPYLLDVRPWAFICSDGGRGREDSGIAALAPAGEAGIPGATVDAKLAAMGDGHSTYEDGVISAVNEPAAARGVRAGMPAREAATLLLADHPTEETP